MEKSGNPPPYSPPQNPPDIGFVPPPQSAHQQHAVTTVVVAAPANYGPNSQHDTCRQCRHQIMTRVETETTTKTHLYALLLCILGCWPCVCIPYCMDSCMNKNHYCPKCGAFLGTYQS